MRLYEINGQIEELVEQMVDVETGEILLESKELMERLDGLQLKRQQILESLARLVLNDRAEAAVLKAEEARLKARRERAEARSGKLMEVLDRECAGKKTDLGVATVSYRRTARVEVTDAKVAFRWLKRNGHGDCYRVPTPEIAKTAVRKLIQAGVAVPGCGVSVGQSCTLR